jgi:hypothetical protein
MSHRLQVLIPEQLDARIRKAAQRRGVSKGEWVRIAVEAALSQESAMVSEGHAPLDRLDALDAPTADIDIMVSEIEAGRS